MKNKYFHNLHYEFTGTACYIVIIDVIFVRFDRLIHG